MRTWPRRQLVRGRLTITVTDAVNIWDEVPDWGGIGARRLVRSGAGLGASIWEIHPGGDYWRHFLHYASDELLIVLRAKQHATHQLMFEAE